MSTPTIEHDEQVIQNLERQLASLKFRLRGRKGEPIPLGTRVKWRVYEEACCQVSLVGAYEGAVISQTPEFCFKVPSGWSYSVQCDHGQVHENVRDRDLQLGQTSYP